MLNFKSLCLLLAFTHITLASLTDCTSKVGNRNINPQGASISATTSTAGYAATYYSLSELITDYSYLGGAYSTLPIVSTANVQLQNDRIKGSYSAPYANQLMEFKAYFTRKYSNFENENKNKNKLSS